MSHYFEVKSGSDFYTYTTQVDILSCRVKMLKWLINSTIIGHKLKTRRLLEEVQPAIVGI